jgi:hypothetical protein
MKEFMAEFAAKAIAENTDETYESVFNYLIKTDFHKLQDTYDQWRVWKEKEPNENP